MAEKKIYKNKHGNLSIEEWIALIHSGEIDTWMRNHNVDKMPCPPENFIASDVFCFYCVACQKQCLSQVKEYKTYYQAKGKKYMKDDLDKMKEELDEDK